MRTRQTAILLAAIAIAACKSQSASPDALDDGQLCQQTCRVLGMIPCPGAPACLPVCEELLRQRCAAESRRVLACEISNGVAGHYCDTESTRVAIRPAYCVAEQEAVFSCLNLGGGAAGAPAN